MADGTPGAAEAVADPLERLHQAGPSGLDRLLQAIDLGAQVGQHGADAGNDVLRADLVEEGGVEGRAVPEQGVALGGGVRGVRRRSNGSGSRGTTSTCR